MAERAIDVMVWGASGFTGRLVAEHLARSYTAPPRGVRPVRWALAGRNRQKLEGVRAELARIEPAVKDVPIVIASLDDPAALQAAAASAKVLLTTAGPYTNIGTPVVEACVRAGTHYADLTAEIPWMLEMQRQFGEEATRKGVKIVHNCGFDSIPSDMLGFMLASAARERHGVGLQRVTTLAGDAKGGFSGGTVASLFVMADAPPAAKAAMADPFCLLPPGAPRPPPAAVSAATERAFPGWNADARCWTAPFIMAFINSRVVRKSAGLLPQLYGANCRVSEVQQVPGAAAAALVSAITVVVKALGSLVLVRALARRVLPKQGEGPSEALRLGGFWKMRGVAVTEPDAAGVAHVLTARAADARDPGYWGTARMMLEAGLCMALQADELAAAGAPAGGFLSPAAATGPLLPARLRAAGMTFEVEGEEGTVGGE